MPYHSSVGVRVMGWSGVLTAWVKAMLKLKMGFDILTNYLNRYQSEKVWFRVWYSRFPDITEFINIGGSRNQHIQARDIKAFPGDHP